MFGIGSFELIVVLAIALIFIGPKKKLPSLARSIGRGLREFQRVKNDFKEHIEKDVKQAENKEDKL